MTSYETLDLTFDDGVATITFTRAKALNALNAQTMDDIEAAIDEAESQEAIGVILTGGGKAFVAGADIAAMRGMSPREAQRFSDRGSRLFRRLEQLPIPVIAAVNGFALGGGCELAMSCDFMYASDRAKFGQPEVNLGLVPGFGGTQRLIRKVGQPMAMELLLSGRTINAAEALRIGLINRIVDGDELLVAASKTIREIASRGPVAVEVTKRLVHLAGDVSLDAGLHEEVSAFGAIFGTQDSVEGISAFLEKRSAKFEGK